MQKRHPKHIPPNCSNVNQPQAEQQIFNTWDKAADLQRTWQIKRFISRKGNLFFFHRYTSFPADFLNRDHAKSREGWRCPQSCGAEGNDSGRAPSQLPSSGSSSQSINCYYIDKKKKMPTVQCANCQEPGKVQRSRKKAFSPSLSCLSLRLFTAPVCFFIWKNRTKVHLEGFIQNLHRSSFIQVGIGVWGANTVKLKGKNASLCNEAF